MNENEVKTEEKMMDYSLTMVSKFGILLLHECDYAKLMANYIFDNGHYKSESKDSGVELATPEGILRGFALDKWVEKQIPTRTDKVIKNERFQNTKFGQFLLKYKIILPWYMDYQKKKTSYKYAG